MSRLIVVGSINMDLVAVAPRHPARGETVLATDLRRVPGGKGANQAVAAARLGAPTALVGCLGRDAFGDELARFLQDEAVDLSHVARHPQAPTGTALIVVAGGDNTIVVVPGANGALIPEHLEGVPFAGGDVVVVQQEIPPAVVRACLERAKRAGSTALLNPAPARPADLDLLALVDVLVLNETELATLSGATGDAVQLAGQLQQRGATNVIATLGARGAVALVGEQVVRVPGRAVTPVDSTGAGDCFVGALAARLLAGDAFAEAIHLANVAASLSVQRFGAGTSMPSLAEVMMA